MFHIFFLKGKKMNMERKKKNSYERNQTVVCVRVNPVEVLVSQFRKIWKHRLQSFFIPIGSIWIYKTKGKEKTKQNIEKQKEKIFNS